METSERHGLELTASIWKHLKDMVWNQPKVSMETSKKDDKELAEC